MWQLMKFFLHKSVVDEADTLCKLIQLDLERKKILWPMILLSFLQHQKCYCHLLKQVKQNDLV